MVDGKPISIVNSDSPFHSIKRGVLVNIGQLFSNYDYSKYVRTGMADRGHFLTPNQLNAKFANVDIATEHWHALRQAIMDTGWFAVCCRGTASYSEGDFIATSVQLHKNCYHIGQVFKVGANNKLHIYARHTKSSSIIADTGNVIQWGNCLDGVVINPSKTKRIVVSQVEDATYVIRFMLWQPTLRDHNNNLKHAGYFLGVGRKSYIHSEGLHSYKSIKRWYRSIGYDTKPAFQSWIDALPAVDWAATAKALNRMRIAPVVKIRVWQMVTGSLYMGEVAYDYLTRHNMIPTYRHNYQYCPHCAGFVTSTYAHQLWECPHSSRLWKVVSNHLAAMDVDMPLTQFSDLVGFISTDKDISLHYVLVYELIYNMFYAIWTTYTDSMKLANSDHSLELVERTKDIHNITMRHYNKTNYVSMRMMPSHAHAVQNKEHCERGSGGQSCNAHMMRYQLLSCPPIYYMGDLNDQYVAIYNDTWCKNSILAHMDGNKCIFNPILSDEPQGRQPQRAPRPR